MRKKEFKIQPNFDFSYTPIYKGGDKLVEDRHFFMKLNSNENPFSPKPKAIEVVHKSRVLD